MPEDPATAPTDARAEATEAAAIGAPRDRRDEDLVPRPSKMRYVAMLFAGILIGRVASSSFTAGALDAIDLFMVIGLAFSIAWAWRSWAKRAMIQRHLDAERRRQRTGAPTPAPRARRKKR